MSTIIPRKLRLAASTPARVPRKESPQQATWVRRRIYVRRDGKRLDSPGGKQ